MSPVFDALKAILEPHAARLVIAVDEADHYSLDTRHVMPNGKVLWFGGVRVGKRYVSFHLMPIYVDAALSGSVGETLSARRQGKACFNFRTLEQIPLAELADLTRRGACCYERRGYLR